MQAILSRVRSLGLRSPTREPEGPSHSYRWTELLAEQPSATDVPVSSAKPVGTVKSEAVQV